MPEEYSDPLLLTSAEEKTLKHQLAYQSRQGILSHSKGQKFHGKDCLNGTISPSSEVFRSKLDKYQPGLISAYLILPWVRGLIR